MAYGRTNASTGAIGAWRFVHAAALPETVLHNTFLAITQTEPTSILLSDAAPPEPAAGDLWFQISDPTDGLAMSSTAVPFKVLGAYQYDGVNAVWTLLTAYYTYLGAWRALAGLPPIGTSLENCTWEQIDRIGAAGKQADYFAIGDEKTITLSTAEAIMLQIIGFNHDNLAAAGGGKAPITFCFKDCMATTQKLNTTNTNASGYSGSVFYSQLTETIYGTLPADLRGVMKNVNKLTSAGSGAATIVTTQDNLFLLSEIEIFGAATNSKAGEGTQYAFFTNGGSRVKKVSGTAAIWWERSPQSSSSVFTKFCAVAAAGTATFTEASNLNGIAAALCV